MTIKASANQLLTTFAASLALHPSQVNGSALFAGVDLGTAYIVTAVVNSEGTPVAGAITRSRSSIRDGLVLDYMGAIRLLREQVNRIRDAGFPIRKAAGAYPPGTVGQNARAVGNVLYAADLEVVGLIDEPTAAAQVLEIAEGAVVGIGGGTTGISVIKDGEAIYTADEATGGTHLDLGCWPAITRSMSRRSRETEKPTPRASRRFFP